MTNLLEQAKERKYLKAVKAYQKLIDKEAKTTRCQSKNPAYCRYHGIPAPKSVNTIKELLEEINTSLETAETTGDLQTAIELNNQKKQLSSELYAIQNINKETLKTENITLPTPEEINHAKTKRNHENKKYLTKLANKIFTNNIEKHIALSGTIEDFAYRNAERKNYPIALSNIYHDKEREYYPTAKPLHETRRVEYDQVLEYAQNNRYKIISARYLPKIDAIVPFTYKDYGITEEEYQKAFLNDDFEERLKSFKEARRKIRNGEPTAEIAGQTPPDKKEYNLE